MHRAAFAWLYARLYAMYAWVAAALQGPRRQSPRWLTPLELRAREHVTRAQCGIARCAGESGPVPPERWVADAESVRVARLAWNTERNDATGNALLHASFGVTLLRTRCWQFNAYDIRIIGCNETHAERYLNNNREFIALRDEIISALW